jgi:AMMECR1 domain-containing protein
MAFRSESDALAQLRPGIDGIVLEHGRHRSTFLPQVWEQLPDPVEFMAHLKHKAGLPVHFWAQDLRLHRYGVTKWKERT